MIYQIECLFFIWVVDSIEDGSIYLWETNKKDKSVLIMKYEHIYEI